MPRCKAQKGGAYNVPWTPTCQCERANALCALIFGQGNSIFPKKSNLNKSVWTKPCKAMFDHAGPPLPYNIPGCVTDGIKWLWKSTINITWKYYKIFLKISFKRCCSLVFHISSYSEIFSKISRKTTEAGSFFSQATIKRQRSRSLET